MVRVNLLPNWREEARKTKMARELCQHALIFFGMTVIFCAFVLLKV